MSIAAQARAALASLGTASVEQIAEAIGTDNTRPIGQALGHDAKDPRSGVQRVSRGVYRWGDSPKAATTPEDLKPLLDFLDFEAFAAVDLAYVARSQDGAFICIDRNGFAWKVEITITARML